MAISNHGMPSGTGRKGGVAKLKRNLKVVAIETRSVRPCLGTTSGQQTASVPSTSREQHPPMVPQLTSTSPPGPIVSLPDMYSMLQGLD